VLSGNDRDRLKVRLPGRVGNWRGSSENPRGPVSNSLWVANTLSD
jgi:hypothetical protein